MKLATIIVWLSALSIGIVTIFWRMEWVYNLPAPVPKNYVNVHPGQYINLAARVNTTNGKPVLLHFYNPDCPCSKFNATHFKSLVNHYGKDVNFIIVPVTKKHYSVKEIQEYFDLRIPVLFDTTIAVQCGVYSTPQAVIIDATQRLYYRGNYNKSRYCTDKKSEYAVMALDFLLHKKANPLFDQYALTAYGCKVPGQ